MAESNGHATIKVDDEKIKERMRDLLAQAWDQGMYYGIYAATNEYAPQAAANPYRD